MPAPASRAVRVLHRTPSSSSRSARSALLTLGCVAAAACTGGDTPAPSAFKVDTASVVGAPRPRSDSLRVDVYVDATVSMGGYVAAPNSEYAQFLPDLESTIQTAWKRADVHYFRFGARSQEISRPVFRSAENAAFYTERITGIDQVIDCQSPRTVTVVLTDLFQSEGDVNAIVAQIKERCFRRGLSVAVLGVPSAFNGTVYDARVPAFRYASTADASTRRPFYALMFGDRLDLEWLLSSLGGAGGRDYVLVAPQVVRRYAVTMRKAPNTRDLNLQGQTGPYQWAFALLPGKSAGTLLADVAATPTAGAPPVRAEQLELAAYRGSAGGPKARADSSETQDITLRGATRGPGDTLHLTLGLTLADPAGSYPYKLVLRSGGVGGFDLPPWVARYSSANPTPSSDPNKTLNLAKFVADLRRAASSITQPAVATWYVTVRKQ